MKKAPCAKLTMRMMPKISVRPTLRKNSSAACDNALRHSVTRKPRKSISGAGGRWTRNSPSLCGGKRYRPRFPKSSSSSAIERHLPARGCDLVTGQRGDDLRYWQFGPRHLLHLHYVAALHCLVVAGAHRYVALDRVDCRGFQCRTQLIGIDAVRFLDPGLQHLARLILLAFEHVGQCIVFLPPLGDERLVCRIVDGENVARRTRQADRRIAHRTDAVEIDNGGDQLDLVVQEAFMPLRQKRGVL